MEEKSIAELMKDRKSGTPMTKKPESTKIQTRQMLVDREDSAGGPRVKFADNKIQVDVETMQTERGGVSRSNPARFRITGGTYLRSNRQSKWKPEETDLFYEALCCCGTDFFLIKKFFPDKTRDQVRQKYKREERSDPRKLDECLRNKKKFDRGVLERIREIEQKYLRQRANEIGQS
ncbi:MAG: putative transcription initiation factor TFIIIB subunit Bdp1 [Amphiamblys sp. WSBS2006]|nr:MAG: putative transcription initiation factor TFIIIB subunit Bdp1 [Amphiamblys sp. WSBS2006]